MQFTEACIKARQITSMTRLSSNAAQHTAIVNWPVSHMHPAIRKDGLAVITGAAAGIGYAIAQRLAEEGMQILLFDRDEAGLAQAMASLRSRYPGGRFTTVQGDVSDDEALARLFERSRAIGDVSLLVNNAAVVHNAGPWNRPEVWHQVMDINFWSVLKVQQLFVEQLIAQPSPAAIVNLGSKEGITTPPGNAAYSVSKAALRVLTEQLAHELRQRVGHVSAHLLIPGYTFTPMNFPGMAPDAPKPDAPWSAAQVADRLVEGLTAGHFYIFCEDNEVTRELDQYRMQWAADDLILNRPALSRWHPDYREAFAHQSPVRLQKGSQ
jgi:NAD(P)-dependent dehydrogenase (short-subunit alcohol dehydrogenase family)